jgi:hypothetical protein
MKFHVLNNSGLIKLSAGSLSSIQFFYSSSTYSLLQLEDYHTLVFLVVALYSPFSDEHNVPSSSTFNINK